MSSAISAPSYSSGFGIVQNELPESVTRFEDITELLTIMLSFADHRTLFSCCLVNKRWNSITCFKLYETISLPEWYRLPVPWSRRAHVAKHVKNLQSAPNRSGWFLNCLIFRGALMNFQFPSLTSIEVSEGSRMLGLFNQTKDKLLSPSLRRLDLTVDLIDIFSPMPRHDLCYLLDAIPQYCTKVHTLRIKDCKWKDQTVDMNPNPVSFIGSHFPYLRSLTIEKHILWGPYGFHMIAQSPHLKNLVLKKVFLPPGVRGDVILRGVNNPFPALEHLYFHSVEPLLCASLFRSLPAIRSIDVKLAQDLFFAGETKRGCNIHRPDISAAAAILQAIQNSPKLRSLKIRGFRFSPAPLAPTRLLVVEGQDVVELHARSPELEEFEFGLVVITEQSGEEEETDQA